MLFRLATILGAPSCGRSLLAPLFFFNLVDPSTIEHLAPREPALDRSVARAVRAPCLHVLHHAPAPFGHPTFRLRSRPSVSTTPRPYHPGSNDGPQPRRFVYALGRRNDLLGKRVHHYHRGFLNSVPGGGSSIWSSSLPLVRARQRMLKPIKWSGATCVAEQKRHASQH